MAPVVLRLSQEKGLDSRVCVTGQHREMLDQVLAHFQIVPDYDLNLMKAGQGLTYVTSAVLEGLEPVFDQFSPDWVIVQGDTTTAFAGALAAFYRKIKVAHVEAGLRTGNIYSPWPEEMNRKLAGQLSSLHFPPTTTSRQNLLREGVSDRDIEVTGNTVIDALMYTRDIVTGDGPKAQEIANRFPYIAPDKRMILVTGHRRENFDGGLERIFRSLAVLAKRSDLQIVFPVHLNPKVQAAANSILKDCPGVHLVPPVPYEEFVWLMNRSYFIVTDSGGVQEEAPSLGKPVLVTRENTERPEAVDAGTVELVGTDGERLLELATSLLDNEAKYKRMSEAINPYGDGLSADRIVRRLVHGAVS
jgi:UDP-N-acetylglucosamine 2-epimerase (non-hydrolysing)